MFTLDLLPFSHGLLGVVYTYLLPQYHEQVLAFYEANLDLFCLLSLYMWGACVVPICKVCRYVYLFGWLPKRLKAL